MMDLVAIRDSITLAHFATRHSVALGRDQCCHLGALFDTISSGIGSGSGGSVEAALKCRSCRKGRYAPPVHMIKLTETREITPYKWVHPDEER
jgi:hypothetical protein